MPDGSDIDLAKVAHDLIEHLKATHKFNTHDKETSKLMDLIAMGMDFAKGAATEGLEEARKAVLAQAHNELERKAIQFGMDVAKEFGTKGFSSTLPSGTDFKNLFATTIGKEVYLPKVIRDNPLSLMEVGTHECQHTLQFDDTKLEFVWFYLADNSARAQFEADAYASGMIVYSWLTGVDPMSNIDWAVQNLNSSYHLRPTDGEYAKVAMKSLFAAWSSGVIMTRSARTAIAWLEANYPQLKGAVQA